MAEFNDLEFVRIDRLDLFNFLVPRELFEQVKDSTFNIDKIYQLAHTFISNPTTRFYVLVDDKKVKGILWAYINLLSEKIQVAILSVDKEYQFGDILKKTLNFIHSWQGENENMEIEFMTIRPRVFEEMGFEKSKHIIMEKKNVG